MALAEYGNALNIDTDGSGNPILVDPDSGDTIAIYDRASGGWQVTEIEAATGDFDSVNTVTSFIDPAGVTHTGELADASDVGDGGGDFSNQFPFNETGEVASGDAGVIMSTTVPDGSSFEVTQIGVGILNKGNLPVGMNITIVTLDSTYSGTEQTIVYSGDGTESGDITGNPIASYSNTSGGSQTVGLVVDNGHFSASGTGSTEQAVVVGDSGVV